MLVLTFFLLGCLAVNVKRYVGSNSLFYYLAVNIKLYVVSNLLFFCLTVNIILYFGSNSFVFCCLPVNIKPFVDGCSK